MSATQERVLHQLGGASPPQFYGADVLLDRGSVSLLDTVALLRCNLFSGAIFKVSDSGSDVL
jgi:hypothetical protein